MLMRLSEITPNPTQRFISIIAFVSAAAESVSPFDSADASLASGPPFLAVAEPALLLLTVALGAFCGAIGNADPFDPLGFRCRLVGSGVEGSIRRHQTRRAS